MAVERVTPILNVASVADSQRWFEALGWSRGFSWPHGDPAPDFGSVCIGATEIFLCQDGQGGRGEQGAWMTWWVPTLAQVDLVHALAMSLGAGVAKPPTDEPWGVREFHLRHPDGHVFRVSAMAPDD
jgi:hypothetical protein